MITIIFGAGASYGSGQCRPHNPPLGKDLFKSLDSLGGVFSNLDVSIKKIFEEKGFEAGMAFIPNDSRIINSLQKELATYLSSFSIMEGNAYLLFLNKIIRFLDEVKIVTLNYDLLIEQSLFANGIDFDYNASGSKCSLLKPHGSSNFLPCLPEGSIFSGNTFVDCGSFFDGLDTHAVFGDQEVRDWCDDPANNDLSPVLSLYQKDKRVVVNRSLIEVVQSKTSECLENSDLIVLVGVCYVPHDIHIWEPIQRSKAEILIVDPYPENTVVWARDFFPNRFSVIQKGFEKAVQDIYKKIWLKLA